MVGECGGIDDPLSGAIGTGKTCPDKLLGMRIAQQKIDDAISEAEALVLAPRCLVEQYNSWRLYPLLQRRSSVMPFCLLHRSQS